jgi:hypothetical protein
MIVWHRVRACSVSGNISLRRCQPILQSRTQVVTAVARPTPCEACFYRRDRAHGKVKSVPGRKGSSWKAPSALRPCIGTMNLPGKSKAPQGRRISKTWRGFRRFIERERARLCTHDKPPDRTPAATPNRYLASARCVSLSALFRLCVTNLPRLFLDAGSMCGYCDGHGSSGTIRLVPPPRVERIAVTSDKIHQQQSNQL